MRFAANPVADFFAPPPDQPAAAKPADAAGSTFDDHLQAQTAHDARAKDAHDARDAARADQADRAADRVADRADDARGAEPTDPAQHEAAADGRADSAAHEPEQSAHEAHASHPAQTTPAPLLVQLIAAATPQTQAAQQTQTQTAPVVAATTAAVSPPPEAPIAIAEATPQPAQNGNAAKKTATAKSAKVLPAAPAPEETAPQTTAPATAAPLQASAAQPTPPKGESTKSAVGPIGDAPARETAPQGAKPDVAPKFEPQKSAPVTPGVDADRPEPAVTGAAKASAASAAHAAANAANDASTISPAHAATPALTSNAAAPLQAPLQAQHAAAPVDQSGLRTAPIASQVGHEIVRRFDGGNTSFDIRLDPPELGRVDVRLEVSRDQRVTATISADNPQALQELARHARDLQQSLQSAGLELSDKGLSFDLRQGGDNRQQAGNDAAPSSQTARGGDPQPEQQAAVARPRLETWRGVRLDLMV